MALPRLIALDWGTSTLRAFLLGEAGECIEERVRPWGVMHLPDGGFAAALHGVAGDWLRGHAGLALIASGMVGSAQGWREAPYVPCPAGVDSLVGGLTAFDVGDGVRLHIVPGVRNGRPDVMRGEETQVVGALVLQRLTQATLLMPGTHSKWVELRHGRIDDFRTFMTGELFAVLRDHSILGRPVRAAAAAPDICFDAFDRGVRGVQQQGSAMALLFSARSLVLTGQLPAEHSLDYLSGLLIGDEVRAASTAAPVTPAADAPAATTPLVLIGEPALCARYRRTLALCGVASPVVLSNTAVAGLWHIAGSAGLVPALCRAS